MKSLITGAGGFAGSHLTEYLLGQNHEVVAAVGPQDDLANLRHNLPRMRLERLDIRDAERVEKIVAESRPGRIYHLAAAASPKHSLLDPRSTYDINVIGTFNFLDACRKVDLDCRFLYVSSASVYGTGEIQSMPLREDCPFRPADPYAGSKAAAEVLAFQYFKCFGVTVVCARPFNHTGPRQPDIYICSSLARQIADIEAGNREPIVTTGNLKLRRDFSDVRDIVRGYFLLLEKGTPGEAYQLCSGRPVLLADILQTLVATASKTLRIETVDSKVRQGETSEFWGDYSKAAKATGWAPEISLQTTLVDLREYWDSNVRRPGPLL